MQTRDLEAISADDYFDAQKANFEKMDEYIRTHVEENDYSQVESMLLIEQDAHEGVKSSLVVDPTKETYPTGVALVRDATEVKPLGSEGRLAPDALPIKANNMLLRSLGTLRGINQTLEFLKTKDPDQQALYVAAQKNLANFYLDLFNETRALSNDSDYEKVTNLQNEFHTRVFQNVLQPCGLTAELTDPKEFNELLYFYRDLASSIDPAKTLVTESKHVTKDRNDNEVTVMHTETSYPITEKTAKQREQLDALLTNTVELGQEKNFHNVKSKAFQLAEQAHYDCLIRDDTRLSAQNRKNIAPTLKNGYVVKNELKFYDANNNLIEKLDANGNSLAAPIWNLRCASTVYVGKGEDKEKLEEFTAENLVQLRTAAQKFAGRDKLHWMILNTATANQEEQSRILDVSHKVGKSLKTANNEDAVRWTKIPINFLGQVEPMQISAVVKDLAKKLGREAPGHTSQKTRMEIGADIFDITNEAATRLGVSIIALLSCASGQDRTHIMQKVGVDKAKAAIYSAFGIKMTEGKKAEIELLGARSGHDVVIAHLAAPGSPGIKNDSKKEDTFTKETISLEIRKDAETNKPGKKLGFNKADIQTIINDPQHQKEAILLELQREMSSDYARLYKELLAAKSAPQKTQSIVATINNKQPKVDIIRNTFNELKEFDVKNGDLNYLIRTLDEFIATAGNISPIGKKSTFFKTFFGNSSSPSGTQQALTEARDKLIALNQSARIEPPHA